MFKAILATAAVATTLAAAALPSHHWSVAVKPVKSVKVVKAQTCTTCKVSSCPKGSGGDCGSCPYGSCGG